MDKSNEVTEELNRFINWHSILKLMNLAWNRSRLDNNKRKKNQTGRYHIITRKLHFIHSNNELKQKKSQWATKEL